MSLTTSSETMKNQEIYYETMYILRPDIAEEEVNKHIEKYNKLLETMGGKILDSQMRGKRRLAYPISKNREGIYVQLSHQGDGQHIEKIERAMRLSEDVIRYMTLKQNGPLPTPKPKIKPSEEPKNEENVNSEDNSSTVAADNENSKNNTEQKDADKPKK